MAPHLTGSGVILNCLNPGLCHSEIVTLTAAMLKFFLASSKEVGSRKLVASAVAGPESHGKYITDAKVDENAPFLFMMSQYGRRTALSIILEKHSPGVTKNP